MKRVLTFAGSDSGGGAGLQADIKTVTVLGGYGLSVVTALTAQNTKEVRGARAVPPDFVRLQADAVLEDIGADAAKTGMLAGPEVVEAVAAAVRDNSVPNLVVDPVMAAASGGELLAREAVATLKKELLPLAVMVTPNLDEAAVLAGRDVQSLDDMREAARIIHGLGPQNVLVKGGHLPGRAVDVLYDGRDFHLLEGERIGTENTHGTGCTMSAALAFFLAEGQAPLEAARSAKEFVTQAIRHAPDIGSGFRPSNPYAWLLPRLDREAVLDELREALARLLREPLGGLIPEIRSNLGYAVPGSRDWPDVAAVPGRISQIGSRLVACSEPAFGATRHVARVILTAMKYDQEMRSAIDIRCDKDVLAACEAAGLIGASFDRAEEPPDVREREGSSLAWGVNLALSRTEAVPDYIFDSGGMGKEPVVRILGRTPCEVVDKVVRIGRSLD